MNSNRILSNRKKVYYFLIATIIVFLSCTNKKEKTMSINHDKENKKVVYQVFTRLFGNTNSTNKPWGTIEENGVGKFNDFTDKALKELKDLGVTHMWYTGVLHHAMITDYTSIGISNDDPDIVKGRAGSPYAVKDYYNVDPDLAIDPEKRLDEFEELIDRTHKNGMKVILSNNSEVVPDCIIWFEPAKRGWSKKPVGNTNQYIIVDGYLLPLFEFFSKYMGMGEDKQEELRKELIYYCMEIMDNYFNPD